MPAPQKGNGTHPTFPEHPVPRPRTPLPIAEATGAVEHNRKRFEGRAAAPQPEGPVGDPPAHFDDIDRDLWHEVVALPAPGVLSSADRLLVEVTVQLLRKLRRIDYADTPIAPLTGVEMGHLRACIGSMGCTPADRSRVNKADGDQETTDPLAVLLGANGSGHGHTN